MDISSIILSALSDNILLYAQIILISIITGKQPIRSRTVTSTVIIIILDLIFDLNFCKVFSLFQFAAVAVNSIKVCILVLYVLNTYLVRHILVSLIIQFMCSVLNAGINSVFHISTETHHLLILFAIRLCLFIVSLIILTRIKKFTSDDKSIIIPNHIYVIILLYIFTENGLTSDLSHNTSNYNLKINIAKILVLLLIVCTFLLIVSLTVNAAYKRYYLMLSNILEKQVRGQLSHYEKMEQVNKEIRRFRHDYNNHMNCIGNMIKGNKNEDALKYIKNMSGKLPSDKFMIKTGNYIADAILTDKQEEAKKYNIEIKFDGGIIPEINSTDLCIILSNALDNAIEACCNIPGSKEILVYGNFQQGCFVLIIKNPAQVIWTSSQGLPASSKKDSVNHGFGLSNIKYTVDKYNGNMKISTEDDSFVLSISFNPSLYS